MTPDKGNRKNLVASLPFQKGPIHLRETVEPHIYKPFYTGSDDYFTKCSHYEEKIENFRLVDEFSDGKKEDTEDSEQRKTLFKTLFKCISKRISFGIH